MHSNVNLILSAAVDNKRLYGILLMKKYSNLMSKLN